MIRHVLSIWGIWQLPGERLFFSPFSILRNKDGSLPYETYHSSLQDIVIQLDSPTFLIF